MTARPGNEHALAEAARALVGAAEALPRLANVRVLRNLGRPADHVVVAAYEDAAGEPLAASAATAEAWARLADCCAAAPAPEPGALVVRFDGMA